MNIVFKMLNNKHKKYVKFYCTYNRARDVSLTL